MKNSVRSSFLESIDKMLSWTFDSKYYLYSLKTPLQEQAFCDNSSVLSEFERKHGYFSSQRPLVGRVTEDPEDTQLTVQALKAIHQEGEDPQRRTLALVEMLTKVLAYRDLKKGEQLLIPTESGKLILFEVDKLFNLWDGMPAFGLVPKDAKETAPILLYRGTDLSLLSQRGLASIISDFDTKGPGLSAFLHARKSIHNWLLKVSRSGVKARVMGYSLGGALAAYTLVYEHELINVSEPSFACNSPGVSKRIFNKWNRLAVEQQPPYIVFVTRGDLVSKIGWLFGEVNELSLGLNLYPIASHVVLVSGQPRYYQYAVDLSLENQTQRLLRK